MVSDAEVKDANKRFFDIAADIYEEVDVRRGEKVSRWLDDSIDELKRNTGGKALLDKGCGTGFVMRKASGKFDLIIGVDISKNMLKEIRTGFPVCADIDYLPFKDDSFDAAVSVAVMHHVLDHRMVFHEAQRVLRSGGIFYSDHDIDSSFVRLFGWLVKIRRKFCDNSIGYLTAKKELTKELYERSEIHHDGIESERLLIQLKEAGFERSWARYHWLGLNTLLNALFSISPVKYLPRGWAPNASLWAKK